MNTLPSVKLDDKLRTRLSEFTCPADIPEEWRGTPVEAFIMSQNFGWPIQTSTKPELLIATCIEFRYALPVPKMYAYVIRRASGRVIGSEFSVGYVLSKGVKHLVMIGHNDCGMSKVEQAKPAVIEAFVEQGWRRELAQQYVDKHGKRHAINDEIDALHDEYLRLHKLFPRLVIAPLFTCLFDNKLYLPNWYRELKPEQKALPHAERVPDGLVVDLP